MADVNELLVRFDEREQEYVGVFNKIVSLVSKFDDDSISSKKKHEMVAQMQFYFTKLYTLVQYEKVILAESRQVLDKYPTLKTAFLKREQLVKTWIESLDSMEQQQKDLSWTLYNVGGLR